MRSKDEKSEAEAMTEDLAKDLIGSEAQSDFG
jgi:hypothetical protein